MTVPVEDRKKSASQLHALRSKWLVGSSARGDPVRMTSSQCASRMGSTLAAYAP